MFPQIVTYIVRTRGICLNTCFHNLNFIKRNAGHSKWANIRHIKAAKDAQKAAVFHKMQRLIRLAIQEGGGPDPTFNARLASIIEQAKGYNMPASTIKTAVESSAKDMKNNKAKSMYYEIRGPGGCIVIVSVLTENTQKIKSHLNTAVRKCNCSFTEGSVPGVFEHKGVIQAVLSDGDSLEKAVDHAIEVGADDVTEVDIEDVKTLQFVCETTLLNQVQGKLVKLGYNIKSADNEFLPKMHVELGDRDLEAVGKLYDKLENDPDVIKLTDNIL